MDTEYLKKVGMYVLGAIISIGLVFYFGYHIWNSFAREIETVAAVRQSYEEVIEAQGYIFRTETVISGTGGAKSVVPSASEGEHIRKGGSVAVMYSEFSPETVARIAEIDEQIALISRYKDAGDVSLKDTSGIDGEIEGILSEIRGLSDGGDAGGAVSLRPSLVATVGERTMLTGGYADPEGEIEELKSERASLLSDLGSVLGTVHTPVSGYYYSEADGYEEIFKAEELSDISLKELRELVAMEPGEAGNGGKTVTKSRWYLVCMVEESEKNTYKAGDKCSVRFRNTDMSLEMSVENVLYDKEGAAVVLSSNMMPEGFDFYRTQDVELMKKEFSGLAVPAGAVRMINGETGVYILDVATVSFRSVEILHISDNTYIVKLTDGVSDEDVEETEGDGAEAETEGAPPLRLHDIIIVEGKGLYEGKIIGN
ncbi:MAG: hypothetical protein IJD22_01960 [Clostridia bacterium]|nr:hypothetical protein [Clostridia bacterium]